MNYQEAIDFLFPLRRFGMKPGLLRVDELMQRVAGPHKRLGTVVHIAGTNGKGAVASAQAAIWSAAGYRTGLYTSPHLSSYTERIRVDGTRISPRQVAEYCTALKEAVTLAEATFFEATTAIAFMHFAAMDVDVSVIEVGMGGRLDATNVVEADYVIIPSISRDHTGWLGNTIEEIAGEKAAVITHGARVYTAVEDDSALNVIRERAEAVGAAVVTLEETAGIDVHSVELGRLVFSIETAGRSLVNLQAPVTGGFHVTNLSLAVLLAIDAGIEEDAIRQGLLSFSETGYRARLERLSREPDIVVDVSHNPDGIEKSVSVMCGLRDGYRDVYVILGLVRDKETDEIVRRLKPLTDTVIAAGMQSERGMEAEELAERCRSEGFGVPCAGTLQESLDYVAEVADKEDLVLITGSFYLAGEALDLLKQ